MCGGKMSVGCVSHAQSGERQQMLLGHAEGGSGKFLKHGKKIASHMKHI